MRQGHLGAAQAQPLRYVDRKLLRCGYTTGSCAAGAARAAALMLLGDDAPSSVKLMTPRGVELTLDVLYPHVERDSQGLPAKATCAIRKDAGDDPDTTDGALVYATVEKASDGVRIDGGVGVGRVTKPGLDQPVGAAAINSTPRRMIREQCEAVMRECGHDGGLAVTIFVPDGERLATHTFNPKLGIEGGISILGTSGIVDPMSEAALAKTIRAEVGVIAAAGAKDLLITLGNFSERFAVQQLGLSLGNAHITCSNLIGDALSAAIENGMGRTLVIGHPGKLSKVALGITNTHSHNADGRIEALTSCALAAGASLDVLKEVAGCITTDAAIEALGAADMLDQTMQELRDRVDAHFRRYVHEQLEVEFVCYTDRGPHAGILFESAKAKDLATIWRQGQ